jgi:peptidoglycan/xylan/chitin deacetylase (PgdA/CDA1 family)
VDKNNVNFKGKRSSYKQNGCFSSQIKQLGIEKTGTRSKFAPMISGLKYLSKKLFAAALLYSGLIEILRYLGRNHAKILLYHSISTTESSFIKGTNCWIPPERFNAHLNYLKKFYRVISLQELVEHLEKGVIPSRSVVVTFDDGFADNFLWAYPYLKRHQITATIFLTTDAIDNHKPIWIQELCYLVNTVGVERIVDHLNASADKLNTAPLVVKTGSDMSLTEQLEKHLVYRLHKSDRENIICELYSHFHLQKKKIFSNNNYFLNWYQIHQMHADKLCFGNHGASHSSFGAMSLTEQKNDIINSKRIIEQNIGKGFLPFAYPFGQSNDYTYETAKIIRQTGHNCIVTAEPTSNDVNASPYELGRIHVENVPVYLLAFEMEKETLRRLFTSKNSQSQRTQDG